MQAIQKGRPRCASLARPRATNAPSIMMIALREVHLLGRLVDQHEAERDQAIDAPVGEAAHDELKDLQPPGSRTPLGSTPDTSPASRPADADPCAVTGCTPVQAASTPNCVLRS